MHTGYMDMLIRRVNHEPLDAWPDSRRNLTIRTDHRSLKFPWEQRITTPSHCAWLVKLMRVWTVKLYTRKKGKESVAEQPRQRETFEQSFLNLDVLSLKRFFFPCTSNIKACCRWGQVGCGVIFLIRFLFLEPVAG